MSKRKRREKRIRKALRVIADNNVELTVRRPLEIIVNGVQLDVVEVISGRVKP